jgi:hypothetical protein
MPSPPRHRPGGRGHTDIDEETLACGPHNRLVDHDGWTTRKRKDGTTGWIPTTTPALTKPTHAESPAYFWMIEVRIFSEPASDRCVYVIVE